MALKTISRVSFFTNKAEELVRFYGEVFGFTLMWDAVIGEGENGEIISKAWHLDPGAHIHGKAMRAPRGDMEIQFTYMTGQTMRDGQRDNSSAPRSGDVYFVIHVPDLDETIEKLKPFNVEVNRPPMKMTAYDAEGRSFPVYEMVIYDPQGTPVIIVQDPDSLNPHVQKPQAS